MSTIVVKNIPNDNNFKGATMKNSITFQVDGFIVWSAGFKCQVNISVETEGDGAVQVLILTMSCPPSWWQKRQSLTLNGAQSLWTCSSHTERHVR